MTGILKARFATVLLALLSLGLVILSAINFRQRSVYQLPGDGVSWIDSHGIVQAWIVDPGGPGERAGIHEGDVLSAINGIPIARAEDAYRIVYSSGVWTQVTYNLERSGEKFETTLVTVPQDNSKSAQQYLELIGLLYLFIGAFILMRRWSAPKSLHFYSFCLASFVLYTFSFTGKLNGFDSTIYWLNVVAWCLQPALFLDFCMRFPQRQSSLRDRVAIRLAVYLPGATLLVLHAAVITQIVILPVSVLQSRWLLDRVELIYMAGYFVLGAVFLERAYAKVRVPLIKQQLKWVTRGTLLSIVPFAAIYAVPYFLGFVPTAWMKLSVLSLAFLPITFGYAIMRYRLMDVDIIFRRGIAYTLATATIVGLYLALIALSADLLHNWISVTGHGGWILAIVVTAFLFQPLVNWIQARLDKFFNRERYDYRTTLLDFARELTSELHVDHLLDRVAGHLSEVLGVDRLAVFTATESNGFSLTKSRGLDFSGPLDLSFLDPQRPELQKGYLFFESVKRPFGLADSVQETIERLDLHYYIPFKVKERTLGYLGLGKTREGDFLSSEDVDLLRTVASTVTIGLENARLYESLEERAVQYQTLREFSENVIESISVGVLACDLEQRIEMWNSSMEPMYGLKRSEVEGKKLAEVFPPELLAELPPAYEPHRVMSLYKFRLRTADGRHLIINLSAAPLLGKDDQVIGRLLIMNDLTERVNLETQLAQAEKLSSIGLLAAGVAHEVNTPLAVITSQAQMLMKQIPVEDPRSRILDKIIKQSFRASEIVNNLLKFSRVSGSEHSELDLNKLIRETLSLVEPMLKASKITLNAQLDSDLPLVFGNSGKLQQVFMNLIMNARDAMPRGGELTLATESENSTVQVEVSDNGVGISADHLDKIFDPFFTTKSTSRGTGLGLAVTYGIIREHAGKIRVESTVGQGTSFRLEFPTARKAVHVS
ncbi:MAG TPA: ATP-binding protein [Terriglobia bacterium]|nr:ATP-binding protein [Terriglobia bacterium]